MENYVNLCYYYLYSFDFFVSSFLISNIESTNRRLLYHDFEQIQFILA